MASPNVGSDKPRTNQIRINQTKSGHWGGLLQDVAHLFWKNPLCNTRSVSLEAGRSSGYRNTCSLTREIWSDVHSGFLRICWDFAEVGWYTHCSFVFSVDRDERINFVSFIHDSTLRPWTDVAIRYQTVYRISSILFVSSRGGRCSSCLNQSFQRIRTVKW